MTTDRSISRELGIDELRQPQTYRAAAAELIATALFVFLGVGSVLAFGASVIGFNEAAGFLGIAFAHGLAFGFLIATIGRISGGHINPAITFGAMITGRITPTRAGIYLVAQLLGAVLGAGLIRLMVSGDLADAMFLGAHSVNENVVPNDLAAVGIEAVLTFVLVWTVFGTASDPRGNQTIAPLAIGFAVLAISLVGVPLTGGSANPARSFGPSLIHNYWTDQWIYWVGPLIGGGAGALAYYFLFIFDYRRRPRTVT